MARGAIMQPTPRGGGVWVGETKTWPSPQKDSGHKDCGRRAALLLPERKLRRANDHAAGAYAPATIMSPVRDMSDIDCVAAGSRSCCSPTPTPLPGGVGGLIT